MLVWTHRYMQPTSIQWKTIGIIIPEILFNVTSMTSMPTITSCPTWVSIALSDLAWYTSAIQWHENVWGHTYLMDSEYEMDFISLHWYVDTYDIIHVAGLSYNSKTWVSVCVVSLAWGSLFLHFLVGQPSWMGNSWCHEHIKCKLSDTFYVFMTR